MPSPDSAVEIVNRKMLRSNPELFRDDGIDFGTWLPWAIENPEPYRRAFSPQGLAIILTDLAHVSETGGPSWSQWRLADDDTNIKNFHSVPFEIPAVRDTVAYRLNVQLPFGEFIGTLVDLEVQVKDTYDPTQKVTYVGQQARWNPGKPIAMSLKQLPKDSVEPITPNNAMGTYWNRFAKAAVAAHAQFFEPSTQA